MENIAKEILTEILSSVKIIIEYHKWNNSYNIVFLNTGSDAPDYEFAITKSQFEYIEEMIKADKWLKGTNGRCKCDVCNG